MVNKDTKCLHVRTVGTIYFSFLSITLMLKQVIRTSRVAWVFGPTHSRARARCKQNYSTLTHVPSY